jgi:ribokinase
MSFSPGKGENVIRGKIVVFGSYINDFVGRGPDLPRPGETVKGTVFKMGPGGKGFNQAVAAKRAAGDVIFITKVGPGSFGDLALTNIQAEGIPLTYVFRNPEVETGTALIAVNERTGQNQILVTIGACGTITGKEIEKARTAIENADIVLMQFETNRDAVAKVIEIASRAKVPVILNPAPVQEISDDLLSLVDIITPNEIEAAVLSGVKVDGLSGVREAAQFFLDKGPKKVVITLGKNGVYARMGDDDIFLPAVDYAPVVDTTGAGDAFNGAFAMAFAQGRDFFEAVRFGNIASSLSTSRYGAAQSMPGRNEIERHYNG